MPTYEYRCDTCSKNFEIVQKMSDDPLSTCPDCGNSVHQIFSAGFGLSFSSKGFYTTDSKMSTADSGTAETPSGSANKNESGSEKNETPACSCANDACSS